MSSLKAIVLTRPAGSNEEFASELQEMNLNVPIKIIPLAKHIPMEVDLRNLRAYDGLIITSKTVFQFLPNDVWEGADLYVVGPSSGRLAKEFGANLVISTNNANELAEYLKKQTGLNLAYLSAKDVSLDFEKSIKNLKIQRFEVYQTVALMPEEREINTLYGCSHLIFPVFSILSWLRLEALLSRITLGAKLTFLPISPNVAQKIQQNEKLKTQSISILPPPIRPNQASMMQLIETYL